MKESVNLSSIPSHYAQMLSNNVIVLHRETHVSQCISNGK